jgi:fructosamine-3-kinase
MNDLDAPVEAAIGRALDRPVRVRARAPLGGGSINRTVRLDTTAGPFVLKWHPAAQPGMFEAEAAGLAALRAAGTSLVVPRVITCSAGDGGFIVLEDLPPGRRGPDFDEAFGRGLAELHRATDARFGFDSDNFCGATPQPNPRKDQWVDFYREARLRHQLRLAASAGRLSASERSRVERLADRLDAWIEEPATGPSLIHGDLWSGNLHTTFDGRPALLDPAVYYAHREAEIGMMTLFGGFSARALAVYDEALPLEAGWRDRNPLYQLYHLLNHLNLFGGGYRADVLSVVARYV